MGTRLPNPRRAKIHRSYSVAQVAALFGVHRNTVLNWIKQGLETNDRSRNPLLLGRHLFKFLSAKRNKNKRPCRLGEIYCVRCRVPQAPALGMADYEPTAVTSGRLIGMCPDCEGIICQIVSLPKLEQLRGVLDITSAKAHSRLSDRC
jgi:hypothetical protein